MDTVSPIDSHLSKLYEKHRADTSGAVATYIPELARVDPDQFGIAIATVDGQVYQVGDASSLFTIQSVSKAFMFGLALEDHGPETMLRRVGVEPTGDPFNAILLDEENNRPPNPMVNAGAIAVTGLIEGDNREHRWERIVGTLSRFAGRELDVDAAVAGSEAATGHRNRAIAYLMRGFEMLREEVDEVLDLYFHQCAVRVNAVDLALMGATLANGGIQPRTGDQVISSDNTSLVLSVMASCGMYDWSGEWIYRVGLPAKSGVGGGIVAILPGHAGIGVFSPRLDPKGNSVRGLSVCEELSREFGLHVFGDRRTSMPIRAIYGRDTTRSRHARLDADERVLSEHGSEIVVVELQGTIVFGSVERLSRHVMSRLGVAREVLLDFRRVTGCDASAARLLMEFAVQCMEADVRIAFCGVPRYGLLAEALEAAEGENQAFVPPHFEELNNALELAEERLLERHGSDVVYPRVELGHFDVCRGLLPGDVDILESLMTPAKYAPGEVAIRPGDEADSALFILEGGLTVSAPGVNGRPGTRLRSIGPGSLLGEMGLLSGAPRSTWVTAVHDVDVLMLTEPALEAFTAACPTGAVTLMRNIATMLGGWVRAADKAPVNVQT